MKKKDGLQARTTPENISRMIRIAIADPELTVLNGIADSIRLMGGFEIVIEATRGDDLIRQLQQAETPPDACVFEIAMPGKNGYDTMKEIRERWPLMKALALTSISEKHAVALMMKNGAKGYLLKNSSREEIKAALISIYENGYYNSELINRNFKLMIDNGGHHNLILDDEDIRFLVLCSENNSYKEIAAKTGPHVRVRTVHGHRDRLFKKLNCTTKQELSNFAFRMGFKYSGLKI